MTQEDIKELLKRYNAGTCTDQEKALLESWYLQFQGRDFDLDSSELELIKNYSWQEVVKPHQHKKKLPLWFQYAAAIIVFSIISIGFLFHNNKDTDQKSIAKKELIVNDLEPGGNRAILTLADGTKVSLDESANGIIAQVEGMKISKTSDGQVVYNIIKEAPFRKADEKFLRYNQITTPRGGQYQVILPDGTKVWLNAASSLKYPEQFDAKTRQVELSGEAYFEVNSQSTFKGERIPFIVNTTSQTVEVLGTHFNINSYDDEKAVKTTLLEGAVKVSSADHSMKHNKKAVYLKPNQQSILNKEVLNVVDANSEDVLAWKNGYFNFEKADIETVMRQLSRWYDVDIVYNGQVPSGTFSGKVQRDMTISKVLEILAFAQINFKIEGKKMVIFS